MRPRLTGPSLLCAALITTLLPAIAANAAAAATDNLRLYVFDCGSLRLDDVTLFGLTNAETPVRELFVPCYLIEHPQGRLLWDAGLPVALAGQGDVEMEPGATMRYEHSIIDQLAAMGIQPDDIDLIAFSHLHFDHVGAANLFTAAKLLIQDTEFQAGFVDRNTELFQPELYLGLTGNERLLLDGDHDVFGDGSVRLISAPGHTPGHQTLLLQLADTGAVMLSGDLYHFRESRELRRAPVFNFNAEQTFAAMDRVEALLIETDAALWIEHEKALADTLRKAPAFYE